MRMLRAAALAAIAFVCATQAQATVYDFNLTDDSGASVSSGTLTTSWISYTLPGGLSGYNVTGMTGTYQGQAISYVANPNPPQFYGNSEYLGDGLMLQNANVAFDEGGLIFQTASGYHNLLGFPDGDEGDPGNPNDDGYMLISNTGPDYTFQYANLSLSAVAGTTAPTGGTQDDPVALPQGQISGISGALGGDVLEQFYTFSWAGGAFSSDALIADDDASDSFRFLLTGRGVSLSTDLNDANGFTGTLSGNLAAGTYSIGLYGLVPVDPAFTINFASPVQGRVPEPASWAMMLAGFGAIGGAMRSRRKAVATA